MTPGTVQPDQRRASIRAYVAAVLVSVAFILVRQALEPGMPGQLPFLVLSAAPLLAAWYGGVGPGLLALALCAGAGQVLFARGPDGGMPESTEGWLRLGSFVVLGALSVWLIASRRTALHRLQREHAELQAVVARQRAAEDALRSSQARLQQLFETNLLGIVFLTLERRVLDANDEMLRIWGRTREDLANGIRLDEITPEDFAEQDRQWMRDLHAHGRIHALEKQYQRPDGSRVWVLVGAACTDPGECVAFVLDISDRKQADLALRTSEQRARELAARAEAERAMLDATLDAVPAGIILADPQGKLLRANPANRKLWGTVPPSEDVVAQYRTWKGWWADKGPRHGERIQVRDWAMARALRGETVQEDLVEIEPFDAPGERRTVVNSAAPVRDAQGQIRGAVVAQTDISALMLAETALRENAAMFQSLADNIAQLAWMTDATGFIGWYNRRWFDYTGSTMEQMRGWGWQWVHHPDHVARVMAKFRRHIASGEPWEDTFPLRSKDGEYRWFLSRAFPLRDHAGRIVSWFGTNTDVNAQRQAEEALRNADRRKDEFIAVLAHELRNPLAPVRNAVEILKRIGLAEPRLDRIRDIIDRQVTHMARLIDDLLDVSRIARGKLTLRKEPCDVAALVCQTTEDYRASLEAAQQRVVVHGCEQAVWVEGDPVRLAQMVGNLLTNAARFSSGAGTVDVRTLPNAERGTVQIVVTDTGLGMDEELLGRLFDPFSQATQDMARSKGGLGLGLALTKGLAELHGGGVMAESDGPSHGSRFTITLPLARTERQPRMGTGAAPEGTSLRILVIEDNHDAAASLGELLQLGGHQVELAYDGQGGIEAARRMRPDAVISDIGLPGEVSGFDVARALKDDIALEGVYLMALSGYADSASRKRCVDAGFDTHLAKPPDISVLEQALATVAARKAQHAATREAV